MRGFAQLRAAAEQGDEGARQRLRLAADLDLDNEAIRYLNQPFRFVTRSPIESLLASAMLDEAFGRVVPEAYDDQRVLFVSVLRAPAPPGPEAWFRLETLAPIGPYEADILLSEVHAPDRILAVVECDGHEFHERTKEQAAHDKRRDRYLAAEGYRVLRFAGSEIFADPNHAAREVYAFLAAELHRKGR